MDFDWKSAIRTIAPSIATAFGTPLLGKAVSVLGNAILGDPNATEDQISNAIQQGLSPDQLLAIKKEDNDFIIKNRELDLQNKDLDYRDSQAYLVDTQDARKNNSANRDVFFLACVLLTFYGLILIGALFGCYGIISGGIILKDVSTVGIVCTFLGGLIGTIGAMAGQVISFYFGSSKGSEKKTDQLADAFKNFKQ